MLRFKENYGEIKSNRHAMAGIQPPSKVKFGLFVRTARSLAKRTAPWWSRWGAWGFWHGVCPPKISPNGRFFFSDKNDDKPWDASDIFSDKPLQSDVEKQITLW